jgi:YD repeat-containing protein
VYTDQLTPQTPLARGGYLGEQTLLSSGAEMMQVDTSSKFNAAGELAQMNETYHNQVSSGSSGSMNVRYSYDGYGRVKTVTRQSGGHTEATHYEYNRYGQLSKVQYDRGRHEVYLKDYVYNPFGNIIQTVAHYHWPVSSGVSSGSALHSGSLTEDYSYNNDNELVHFTASASAPELMPRNTFGSRIVDQSYHYGINHTIKRVDTKYEVGTGNSEEYNRASYIYDSGSGYPDRLLRIDFHNVTGKPSDENYAYNTALNSRYGGSDSDRTYKYNSDGTVKENPAGGQYTYNAVGELKTLVIDTTRKTVAHYGYTPGGQLAWEKSTMSSGATPHKVRYLGGFALQHHAMKYQNLQGSWYWSRLSSPVKNQDEYTDPINDNTVFQQRMLIFRARIVIHRMG